MNIDMIDYARTQAIRERDHVSADIIKVISPAKINLVLAVGAKRASGHHNVQTIMHTLALHDTLYVRVRDKQDTQACSPCPRHF